MELGYGNGFPDVSNARAKINQDGKVEIYIGATEVGQGAKTIMSQIGAEVLKINVELPPADPVVAGIRTKLPELGKKTNADEAPLSPLLRRAHRHRGLGFDQRPDRQGQGRRRRDRPRRKLGPPGCRLRRAVAGHRRADPGSRRRHRDPGGAGRAQVRALCPRRTHQSRQHLAADGPAADAGSAQDGAHRHRRCRQARRLPDFAAAQAPAVRSAAPDADQAARRRSQGRGRADRRPRAQRAAADGPRHSPGRHRSAGRRCCASG